MPKLVVLVLLCCGLSVSRAYAETPEHALLRFWGAAAQQKQAAESAKTKSLSREYLRNYFAYMLAGCDELEMSSSPFSSEPKTLETCAKARAQVADLPVHEQSTIEHRELHFRMSALR